MTISLPRQMIKEVEHIRKIEHRTRSELVREALRAYFSARQTFPSYTPTAAELRAIEKGREEIKRGELYTINELFDSLAGQRRKTRAQSHRQRA